MIVFAQIAHGDLDVAVIGQLSSSLLPFDGQLEPRSLKVESLQATLRRRWLIEQSLEGAPMNAYRALVLAFIREDAALPISLRSKSSRRQPQPVQQLTRRDQPVVPQRCTRCSRSHLVEGMAARLTYDARRYRP